MIIIIIELGRESSAQSLTNRAKPINSTSYRQHAPRWQGNWISCEAILVACDQYTHVLFELLRKIIARRSSEMIPTFKCSSIIIIMQDALLYLHNNWYSRPYGSITFNQSGDLLTIMMFKSISIIIKLSKSSNPMCMYAYFITMKNNGNCTA
jgi:hypothetical protein